MSQLTIQQAYELALRHHQAGQLQQAEQIYRQILARQPGHADALHLLGVIAYQVGRHDIAVDLIRQALALTPHNPDAHNNLGNALQAQGQLTAAIAAFRQALALKPRYPEAHCHLGRALKDQGQLEAAIAAYRQALALDPCYAEAHSNLGVTLQLHGQLDAAIAAFRQAVALKPHYPEAYSNLGVALGGTGQHDAALAAHRQAIALRPNCPEFYYNLGGALKAKGQHDEAIVAYRQALALKPDYPEAYHNLGAALSDQAQLDEAIAALRHAVALDPGSAKIHGALVYTLHFHPACDAQTLAEEHRLWNLRHAAPLRQFIQPHTNDRSPERRLRVGYVSPDFREHPVGRFMLPLLAHHDQRQVEIFGYALTSVSDALTRRLRASTDGWRGLGGLSDAQAAHLIRQDHIDILVDLSMHMAHNHLLIFARKPAPVQVTYLAYCSSTGLEAIDYRLSDPYLDPPGMDESVYSERTIRLPETYWCYQPIIASSDASPLPALEYGHITFGCLNNFCKVSEPTLAVWSKVLQAVPNSQLLLHAHEGSPRQRVRERLAREGIDPQRVRFAGFMPADKYFDLHRRIDVALDSFPYGGGTTTCDALWMGVPVVSLVGRMAVGRAGLSLLSNIGLPELAARSEDEYVRIAAALANDLPRLTCLRATLRQRMEQSPLMDAPRFARNIEAAYRHLWRQWCVAAR